MRTTTKKCGKYCVKPLAQGFRTGLIMFYVVACAANITVIFTKAVAVTTATAFVTKNGIVIAANYETITEVTLSTQPFTYSIAAVSRNRIPK